MFGYDWPRLHALLNDLPAALLVAGVFFDVIGAATRRASFRQVGFWTLLLGVLGGVAAVVSGLQAEEHIAHGEAVHRVMETHEELALITVGLFGLVVLWRILRERRMASVERGVLMLLSLAGVGLLLVTGMYGGRLMFDHAAGIQTNVLQAELRERSEEHTHDAASAHDHVPAQGETSPGAAGTSGGEASDHVDPPGTPPHSHEPRDHSHPPGTPPHQD